MNKEQFKEHRKALGLNQTEFGKLLGGYSREHICRVETGTKFISTKLARAFELLTKTK